jgi:hypothetical protein
VYRRVSSGGPRRGHGGWTLTIISCLAIVAGLLPLPARAVSVAPAALSLPAASGSEALPGTIGLRRAGRTSVSQAWAVSATPAALPAPAKSGSEALLGTIGFRSASAMFLGQYVTTGLRASTDGTVVSRDTTLKARKDANPLLFELGLFRENASRFRLLGENGKWVAQARTRQGLRMTASAAKWSAAWGFKAVRAKATLSSAVSKALSASGVDPGLPVCLDAYQGSTRRGLLTLNSSGYLVVSTTAKCGASTLGLFMTDDLPVGASTSRLLLNPAAPVDEITRVRFVAPDRPAHRTGFGTAQRTAAITAIQVYTSRLVETNDAIHFAAADDLRNSYDLLAVTNPENDPPAGGSVDWFSIFSKVAVGAAGLIPAKKGGDIIGGTLSGTLQVAQMGISYLSTPYPQGPRVIDGLSDQGRMVNVVSQLATRLESDRTNAIERLYLLESMLMEGCPRPTDRAKCTSDRRLLQWTAHPAAVPNLGLKNYEDRQIFAYRQQFYRLLVPIMGALMTKWTYVPGSDCFNRAYNREEALGDRGGYPGFGTSLGSSTWKHVVLFTSVFQPWSNWTVGWCNWLIQSRPRPVVQAWTLGSATGGPNWEDSGTPYTDETWRMLFDPYDPENPLLGGMALSPREVACTWLTQKPHGYQGGLHDLLTKWAMHPCHMSLSDPGSGKLVHNIWRWVGPDTTPDLEYDLATDALVWYAPERPEVAAGRPEDDPDIFSWIIGHLAWSPATATPPKPSGRGANIEVLFANLANRPVKVSEINADGTTTVVFSKLSTWTGLAHPTAGTGAIPYTWTTPGTGKLSTHVGAVFLVQADGGDGSWPSIGTYQVRAGPTWPTWQVAEIHGHCEWNSAHTLQVGGILDHDPCGS